MRKGVKNLSSAIWMLNLIIEIVAFMLYINHMFSSKI